MKKLQLTLIALSFILLHSTCSKVTGTISMKYTKAEAIYGDIDSLRNIPLVAGFRPIDKPVGHFIGKDFILIGERGAGIHVYNNTNISNPINTAFLSIPFCKEFYVDGDYLYAESGYDLLKINVQDFRNPFITYRLKNAFSEVMHDDKNRVLLGFMYSTASDQFEAGSPEALEIKKKGKLHIDYNNKMIPLSTVPTMFAGNNGKSKGTINRIGTYYNHVYIIAKDKLHIFSSTGESMNKQNTINIEPGSETIYIDRNRLYIGSESAVKIFLLDNLSAPTEASTIDHLTACDPVLADGDIAYSTLRSQANEGCDGTENVLIVIDVTKARKASEVKTIDMESPYGMTMVNNVLIVGEGTNGLSFYNVKDRKSPEFLIRNKDITAFDVMLHPVDNEIIIVSDLSGIREYRIDWNNLRFTQIGSISYK